MRKIKLKEADYQDFLQPKTMAKLSAKSADSLKDMLGDKSIQQAMMSSMTILKQIQAIEKPYRPQLAQIAIDIATEMYPIITDNDIKIEAEIVTAISADFNLGPSEEEVTSDNIFDMDLDISPEAKRRIINSITQGAAIRGSFAFQMFRNNLSELNPDLVEKYGDLLRDAYGIYDDDNTIAMMLAMITRNQQSNGGISEAVYDEEEDRLIIKAKAVCFPILLQEIIKGLYEIISLQGFSSDREKNQKIVKTVDKATNEPEDIRYGKFIHDALRDLVSVYGGDDPRVLSYFLTDLYRLGDDEFLEFVENLLNEELTRDQIKWAQDTMSEIEDDLKKDDAGM